jgi:hypothetical protein
MPTHLLTAQNLRKSETNRLPIFLIKSPIISPDSGFESRLHSPTYRPRTKVAKSLGTKNRDLDRLCKISRKNPLKRFQIENDSQRGTIPGRSRRKSGPGYELCSWFSPRKNDGLIQTTHLSTLWSVTNITPRNPARKIVPRWLSLVDD